MVAGSDACLWAPLCGPCLRCLLPPRKGNGAQLGMDRQRDWPSRTHSSFGVKVCECTRAVGSWERKKRGGEGRGEKMERKEKEKPGKIARQRRKKEARREETDRHEGERRVMEGGGKE